MLPRAGQRKLYFQPINILTNKYFSSINLKYVFSYLKNNHTDHIS